MEIDTEATAAYIRFGENAVTRTEPFGAEESLVMIDFDSDGAVVGIEVVGQTEFTIRQLLKGVPVEASESVLDRTRYVAADLVSAC